MMMAWYPEIIATSVLVTNLWVCDLLLGVVKHLWSSNVRVFWNLSAKHPELLKQIEYNFEG